MSRWVELPEPETARDDPFIAEDRGPHRVQIDPPEAPQPGDPDREPGETFAPADIGWIDFETRNVGASLKEQGVYRYATAGSAILLPFAIGDAPVEVIGVDDFTRALRWSDMPPAFHAHHERVLAGEAVWCATNAAFDRAAWNYMTEDFPFLEPEHIIDAAVQFAANGLPPALDGAAKYTGSEGKIGEGKALIALFCVNDGATPQTHPAEWDRFCHYAKVDVEEMRSAFKRTRQLPYAEWREYWAAERVNERGAPVDVDFAERCAALALIDKQRSKAELTALTEGVVTTVDQVARIAKFLVELLPPTGREILEKTAEEIDEETGETVVEPAYSLKRDRILKLLAYIKAHREKHGPDPDMQLAERVLQIRLYGGSKTPAKFGKIAGSHVDGRLMGQYVFNGAQQTGRFSSRGVQVHNLARDFLDYEADMIDAIHEGATYDELARFGDDTPVSRKLSLVIRPTFVARPGKVFVWSDFEQIEARVLPWLANTPEAELRLDVFRAVDNDPHKHEKDHPLKVADQYTRTAAQLSGLPIKEITKPLRQRGKVAELALGFGGGKGSLHSMGANYGMHFEDTEAQIVVERWREANQWAVRFWGKHNRESSYGLWGAINQALERPGMFFECGRVGYIYLDDYLGGTLLCRLPSGRFLTYRAIRWEKVKIKDEAGVVIDEQTKLRFGRGYGRVTLWHGLAAENVTQATAADLLRDVIVRMEYDEGLDWMPLVLHTHDELGAEVDEADAEDARAIFAEEMRRPLDWTDGLPIMSDETIAYQYSKNENLTW